MNNKKRHDVTMEEILRRSSQAENGCIEWQSTMTAEGYGELKRHGERFYAHRMSWTLSHGPIPEGLFVCHRCDNRKCINPAHLFLGTNRDNLLDMCAKGRHVGNRK